MDRQASGIARQADALLLLSHTLAQTCANLTSVTIFDQCDMCQFDQCDT